jgi:hypothetical protein
MLQTAAPDFKTGLLFIGSRKKRPVSCAGKSGVTNRRLSNPGIA